MRTIVDETIQFGPPKPTDATVSRRSFLKSAAAAAVFGAASPQTLMAETKPSSSVILSPISNEKLEMAVSIG